MNIQLSEHFSYTKLLRFAFPTIIMMLFSSIYGVIDGVFVSNFIGPTAFAAVNFMTPIIMLLGCVGFIFGTGGSALVAKLLGEGKEFHANQIFSLLFYTVVIFGILLTIIGLFFIEPIIDSFTVKSLLKQDCLIYGRIVFLSTLPLILQFFFHPFLVAAERPKLGLCITVLSGISNILLDAFFILSCNMGIQGAAIATVGSELMGGMIPLCFFIFPNSTKLRLGKTKLYFKSLLKATSNGISEFVTNISLSVVGMLYNYQMLKYAGENGIVAFGVITNTNFIFLSIFIGYAVGTSPIISFHYGAKNSHELQSLFQKNCRILLVATLVMTLLAEVLSSPITSLFIQGNPDLIRMTQKGFMIFVISYLVAGFNIYASSFFTALNNGLVSAIISFMRTLVFEGLSILILPIFFGLSGIWSAIIVAELAAFILSVYFICSLKGKYKYMPS